MIDDNSEQYPITMCLLDSVIDMDYFELNSNMEPNHIKAAVRQRNIPIFVFVFYPKSA